jgi:D-alanyl-D-alanine endopeptidase (penicillin-binding protein 7)
MRWTVLVAASLTLICTTGRAEVTFGSAHAIVVDEATGEVLLQKDGETPAPMASLTKLMTAMVVLDARLDPAEPLRVDEADLDRLKSTHGGVPVGAVVSRRGLLELALIASDNRAASALARHYPGGAAGFQAAIDRKIRALGLQNTLIEEPTGLSPNNRSSAHDMVKVLRAAAAYPALTQITSQPRQVVRVNGRRWVARNTNRLVGAPGWNILLSKTGFTNEAGRCLSMRVEAAGRTVMVVLMGAAGSAVRSHDAWSIRRWLGGDSEPGVRVVAQKAVLPTVPARRSDGALEPRPGFFTEMAAQAAAAAVPLAVPTAPTPAAEDVAADPPAPAIESEDDEEPAALDAEAISQG